MSSSAARPDDPPSDRALRIDAFFAPSEAARAIAPGVERLTLCAHAGHGEPNGEYGPSPGRASELTLERGKPEGLSFEVRTEPLGWSFDRVVGRIVAVRSRPERDELVVAETVAASAGEAESELEPLVRALASFAGISDGAEQNERQSGAAGDVRWILPRYSMRFEGGAIVLRDHESIGPKERVKLYRTLAIASLVLGIVGTAVFVDRVSNHAAPAALFGAGVVPLVLFVGAFAMNEIARYAKKYTATSAPLAWFADDRVVVAPWVSRQGAIDTKPEGRLGAAIACGEIHKVEVHERSGAFAVTLEGLHGPVEVVVERDRRLAETIQEFVEAAVAKVASPKKRQTALMRAALSRDAATR